MEYDLQFFLKSQNFGTLRQAKVVKTVFDEQVRSFPSTPAALYNGLNVLGSCVVRIQYEELNVTGQFIVVHA